MIPSKRYGKMVGQAPEKTIGNKVLMDRRQRIRLKLPAVHWTQSNCFARQTMLAPKHARAPISGRIPKRKYSIKTYLFKKGLACSLSRTCAKRVKRVEALPRVGSAVSALLRLGPPRLKQDIKSYLKTVLLSRPREKRQKNCRSRTRRLRQFIWLPRVGSNHGHVRYDLTPVTRRAGLSLCPCT